jgi:hypothetical protein
MKFEGGMANGVRHTIQEIDAFVNAKYKPMQHGGVPYGFRNELPFLQRLLLLLTGNNALV